ncbi:PepSY-like domain-containing protein [Runella sp.]|jgi:hypothetical protein|uniref:PepSY-like domain-containing protein n=1 Tax=Runella sp. TaxID=1960881 RepID=UPI002620947D|nr:PepSY-like domain-containing protein [Runella sp.]
MKKYLLPAVLILLNLQSCKQKVSYDHLPQGVKTNFAAHVTDAKEVTWEKNLDYYFAYFTMNGEQGMAVFYRADGNWLETDQALSINDLTAEQRKMLMRYKSADIKKMTEVKKNDNTDEIKVKIAQ